MTVTGEGECDLLKDALWFQIRNSKVSHLCMDQGVKENHTATLHPCHGWGPQVGHGHRRIHTPVWTRDQNCPYVQTHFGFLYQIYEAVWVILVVGLHASGSFLHKPMQKHINITLHSSLQISSQQTQKRTVQPTVSSARSSDIIRTAVVTSDRYTQPWLFIEPVHVSVNLHCSYIPAIINKHQDCRDWYILLKWSCSKRPLQVLFAGHTFRLIRHVHFAVSTAAASRKYSFAAHSPL